jgi:hypothetical protein
MKLIFGSCAVKHWFPDFREPKGDTDYITPEKLKSNREHEYHWVPSFQYILDYNNDLEYVDPNFLYTIKVSHAAWNVHWDKSMLDIRFLKSKGCALDKVLYSMLVEEWEIIHGKKKVNLNKPNEYFFNDAVNRKYDHDQLHEMFKFYDKPLHTKIRKDETKALPDRELFEQLNFEDQVKCALEEIYVIATERFIIPHNIPKRHAKYKAMKQLVTTMTKGWFNLFLIVNFDFLLYNVEDERHWMPNLKRILNELNQK